MSTQDVHPISYQGFSVKDISTYTYYSTHPFYLDLKISNSYGRDTKFLVWAWVGDGVKAGIQLEKEAWIVKRMESEIATIS